MSNSLQQVCCGPLQNSANRNQCPDYTELVKGSQSSSQLSKWSQYWQQLPATLPSIGARSCNQDNHCRKPTLRSNSFNCSEHVGSKVILSSNVVDNYLEQKYLYIHQSNSTYISTYLHYRIIHLRKTLRK